MKIQFKQYQIMKGLVIALLLLIPMFTTAQTEISVRSFSKSENDMRARVSGVKDVNNKLCALLIIETSEKGFEYYNDAVVSTEQKDGEIWVFLAPHARFITIKHEIFGTLRDYQYPETIEGGDVYIMELDISSEDAITENYLTIRTNTPNAKIFINNEYVGSNIGEKYLSIRKEHTYRVEAPMYHTKEGKLKLNAETKTEMNIELKPAFGYLNVASTPNGASVEIDGKRYTTPFNSQAMPSGTYTISAFKEMYKSYTSQIIVEDEKTTDVNISLVSNFAKVTLTAKESDDSIYIDDIYKSVGKWSGNLEAGIHKIEVKKYKYKHFLTRIYVVEGVDVNENFDKLEPIVGKLNITSVPTAASIKIDGKDYGTTPNVIKDLLIGKHTITLSKDGYSTTTAEINIEEDKISDYNFTMNEGNLVNIQTDKEGAKLYIDGEYIGNSPQNVRLSFGKHKIVAEYNGLKVEKEEIIYDGKSQNIKLKFTKTLRITSNKNSIIYVDNKYFGYEPQYAELPLGKHKIEARYDGESLAKNIMVTPTSTNEIEFNFRSKFFVSANASYSIGSKDPLYGISFGQAWKNIGWYIGARCNFNFEGFTPTLKGDNIFFTGETSQTWISPNVGLLVGKNKFYWRIGVSGNWICDFWQLIDKTWVMNESVVVAELSTGIQYFGKKMVFSFDIATHVLGMADMKYIEMTFGLGYKF